MKKTALGNVRVTGGFWKEKQDLNRKVTIGAVYDRFYDTGRVTAFSFNWKAGEPNKPHIFWDSDIAKWMEGAAYLLGERWDEELSAKVEWLIDRIEEHQEPDGYFNIYYTVVEPGRRFTNRGYHELYCAGHLIEAAIAYYEATGRDRFLHLMEKYADLIYRVFLVEKSAAFRTPGHEELELALIRLFRLTGEKKWFELAKYFLEERGNPPEDNGYAQSHLPIRRQTEAVGHAVRAGYLYTAMAEYAAETGDEELMATCRALLRDITERKMYLSGGIGQSYMGEAFTIPYDLPDATAYNETCASISMILFADALAESDNDARYADLIEREMYNGMLPGLSLSGDAFFYENPLEIVLSDRTKHIHLPNNEQERLPITQRKKVFDCSCCPPNLNRMIAGIGRYFYAKDGETYFVNQFADSVFTEEDRKIEVKTDYPADGGVEIRCENIPRLAVRMPGWCRRVTASAAYKKEKGYLIFDRPGVISLRFSMPPRLVFADARVRSYHGKCALMRGPILYALEAIDNGENLQAIGIGSVKGAKICKDDRFDHPTIRLNGYRELPGKALYMSRPPKRKETELLFIPYADFANRGESDMTVWVRYEK